LSSFFLFFSFSVFFWYFFLYQEPEGAFLARLTPF